MFHFPLQLVLLLTLAVCSIGKREKVTIALIGDSLVQQPVDNNELIEKLQDRLPEYDLNIQSFAKGASFIDDIRKEQVQPALNIKPDFVLLLWDTDCSDVDETGEFIKYYLL